MIAIYIDPFVCRSSIWWMFPECWGLAVCAVITAVPLALLVAGTVRRFAR